MKLNQHILVGLCGFLANQAVEADGFLEATVTSRYVERGLKYSELTLHPAAEFEFGNSYLGAWAALPLEGRDAPEDYLDEYNFYLGRGWAVGDKWFLDAGVTRYYFPNAEDSTEAYVGMVGELGTITPAVYIYNDFDLDAFTIEGTATAVVPLQQFPFEATARIGSVSQDEDYIYWGLDLIYPIRLSDLAKLSLGVHYADNDFGDFQSGEHFYGSMGIRWNF